MAKRTNRRARDFSPLAFETLERRQLLAGITFADSFSSDAIGSAPAIQATDVGLNWTSNGATVGTGNFGSTSPQIDIGGASQWVGFDGSGQSATGTFTELTSLNGSLIEFDLYVSGESGSDFNSLGAFISGEVGNLLELEFGANSSSSSSKVSKPFEIIVNGQSRGVSGPIAGNWYRIGITLNEFNWDLSWQIYATAGGETTNLTGEEFSLTELEFLVGASGGATKVIFTDDGDSDEAGDAAFFISNVESTDANDLALALNDFVTTDAGDSVMFDVRANDVDDDELSIVNFTQTSNGTISQSGSGEFTYTPDPGHEGADQFDYTIDDGSGNLSTATAYVYTNNVAGLPAYASNPNASAVIYLDFDGDRDDLPFDREGGIESFSAFEQDLIRQSFEYITQAFSMFDVNVTTVLTPDLPKAWIRIRSNGSGGVASVGSFPSATASTAYVVSSDRFLTTGMAHELGHVLNAWHQSEYDATGTKTREYRLDTDGEGSILGIDFLGNVVKWWWGRWSRSSTELQNDLAVIADEISGASDSVNGFLADDHAASFAFATPMSLVGSTWEGSGVINDLDDVDTFAFDWDGGDVDVNAFRVNPFTNSDIADVSSVDLVLTVFDLNGNVVGYANPDSYNDISGLDASVTIDELPAGTYIAAVSSHGDYADIGTYSLTVSAGSTTESNSSNSLDAPTGVRVDWHDGVSASLIWNDVSGATGFSVERSINNVDFSVIGNVPQGVTAFMDNSGLEFGTKYFYRVRAQQGATVSVASLADDVTTRPGGVVNFTVSDFIGTTKVLDWKVQRTYGETGFRIERATDGVNFSEIATVEANRPSYSDEGLDVNQTYTYRIVTLDSLGDAAIAMESDIVARYSFDTNSAFDSSQNSNDNSGTLFNGASVVFDTDRGSNALFLDGINDYVAIPDSTDINIGNSALIDRTITASFKADSTSGRQVIYEEGGDTRGFTQHGLNIYIDNGLLFVGSFGMQSFTPDAFLSTPISAGQWYTVSLVIDSIALTFSGYLDGVLFGAAAGDRILGHDGDIGIGRIENETLFHDGVVNSSGSYFGGLIDDLRIWNSTFQSEAGPLASDDSAVVDNDEHVTISVLANDSHETQDDLLVTNVTQGSFGSVVINPNGTLTYIPNADYFGTDSFTYTVRDSLGVLDVATVSLVVNSTGLVARYNFNDGTAIDSSPKGRVNDGMLINGATIVEDSLRGNLLSLDGLDDYVSVPDSADINNLRVTDRSIFVSFQAEEVDSRQVIYEQGGTSTGINIYLESGRLYVGAWGMESAEDVYLWRAIEEGTWNNIAVVIDSSDSSIVASLNGYVLGTGTVSAFGNHAGSIGIGAINDATRFRTGDVSGSGSFFGGKIDNLRIYNSAIENTFPIALADSATTEEDNEVSIDVLGNDQDVDGDYFEIVNFTQPSSGSVVLNADGTFTYSPNLNYHGSDSFDYTIADGFGGLSSAIVNVVVSSVPDGLVQDRFIFYHNSVFDASSLRGAIDPTKTALLPGEAATFTNYTSYWKGINGIIIDVTGFANVPKATDFEFRVGNDNSPENWPLLKVDPTVEFTRGVGNGGSDQINLIWPDNQIEKQWLQVTLLANNTTDLESNDVFYFGNAIGETGNDLNNAVVNLIDVSRTRFNQSGLGSVGVENVHDFDRNGRVNLVDVAIGRSNQTGFEPLVLIAAPEAVGGSIDGQELGVAREIAIENSTMWQEGSRRRNTGNQDTLSRKFDEVFVRYSIESRSSLWLSGFKDDSEDSVKMQAENRLWRNERSRMDQAGSLKETGLSRLDEWFSGNPQDSENNF